MAKQNGKRAITRRVRKSILKDASLLRGIKQGAGRTPRKPFGNTRRRPNGAKSYVRCLDALHPSHLSLPRAVGGYSVVRTTSTFQSATEVMLLGCFKGPKVEFTDTAWLNLVAVGNVTGGVANAINAAGNAFFFNDSTVGGTGFAAARLVPAAFSVQIMNANALQTTQGIFYIGRTKQVLDIQGDTRTWQQLIDELVSYSSPRLCSAGKLALRGVQVDAIPNNMSVLSDFVAVATATGGAQTWTEAGYGADMEGFAPIFVHNPSKTSLQFQVTIEWRCRFDPGNPAYSSHTFHAPASDMTWGNTIHAMENAGHGVMDIAEKVADYGEDVLGVLGAAAILA